MTVPPVTKPVFGRRASCSSPVRVRGGDDRCEKILGSRLLGKNTPLQPLPASRQADKLFTRAPRVSCIAEHC